MSITTMLCGKRLWIAGSIAAFSDCATMMMPHHQGAIDMAKAELLYGKDSVMRRLAEEIVVDQQSEIQVMQLWLSKKPTANPIGQK